MKKIILKPMSLVLAIFLIFSCFSITGYMWACSYEDENGNTVSYEVAEDFAWNYEKETRTLTVSGHGAMPEFDGFDSMPWNGYYGEIESLVISEGITAISTCAFSGLYKLTKIDFPETLEYIGIGAFMQCLSLEEIDFPDSLKCIDGEQNFGSTKLKNIIFPEGLVHCSQGPLYAARYVEKIVIPKTVSNGHIGMGSPYLKEIINYSYTTVVFRSKDFPILKDNEAERKFADVEYLEQHLYIDSVINGTDFDEQAFIDGTSEILGIKFETSEEIYEYMSSFEEVDGLGDYYTVYCYENSEQHLFCKEENIPYVLIGDTMTETDEATGITAEYDSEVFNGIPDLIVTEGGKNANIALSGLFGKYTSFDISFELGGEKVQPNGKVTISIPIPEGYSQRSTKVYYIDDLGNKTKLDCVVENGYVIFETDHFSEYAIVDESSEIVDEPTTDEPSTELDDTTEDCSCNCHKGGFSAFIWKILRFFYKLFKINSVCNCGVLHY